jgi:hypothetical protein
VDAFFSAKFNNKKAKEMLLSVAAVLKEAHAFHVQ